MPQNTAPKYTRSAPLSRNRLEELKLDRWGYADSGFFLNKRGRFEFKGSRYPLSGEVPYLREFMWEQIEATPDHPAPPRVPINASDIPECVVNKEFLIDLKDSRMSYTTDGYERLFRSHGHTVQEIGALREGKVPDRVIDVVIWPASQADVIKIVESAVKNNVCLVPFGGGTNVSLALQLPSTESRMICSVDTSQMKSILWLDEENLLARVQSGIAGVDLENELARRGYCVGHEPDSMEFSSLGGWVATRASGMKKNVYGNIEDLLVHVSVVTPQGLLQKNFQAPRVSTGPDIHHFILGSEGTIGVVTEVTLKIRPLPKCRKFGCILFHTFEEGVSFLREVAKEKIIPASIRLVDNLQMKFGLALRQDSGSFLGGFADIIKRMYLLKFKGFDPNKMTMCTILYEGTKENVASQEAHINSLASKYKGLSAGEEAGSRGYLLTFLIAYLRDVGLDFHVMAESFETSCPWDRVIDLCRNVRTRILNECKMKGVHYKAFVSYRVTQLYDGGACIYFYFGFNGRGLTDPLAVYEEIETAARDEILENGGSLSHHHGVGKLRSRWLKDVVSDIGLGMVHAAKNYIDPKNIFGINNLQQPSKL